MVPFNQRQYPTEDAMPARSLERTWVRDDGSSVTKYEVRTEDFGYGSMRQGVLVMSIGAGGPMMSIRRGGCETAFDSIDA